MKKLQIFFVPQTHSTFKRLLQPLDPVVLKKNTFLSLRNLKASVTLHINMQKLWSDMKWTEQMKEYEIDCCISYTDR